MTTLKTNLNLAYGAGNWNITQVDLVLSHADSAFTVDGDVTVYYTTDDTTDIKTGASPLAWPFEDTPGNPDLPVVLASPLVSYTFIECGCTGQEDTYTLYSLGDGGQRLALANDIENVGDSALTLVLVDASAAVAATYRGQVDSGTADPPELVVTAVPITGNPPTANAGPDQTVTDTDVSGGELIALDGSGSRANPPATSITTYAWTEGGSPIASGVNPTVNFSVGVHTVTLTVTDNLGGTAADEVIITVQSGVIISADAGDNATVTANACDGTATIQLDGSGSTYNAGTITSYVWTNDRDGTVVGTDAIELVPLTLVGTNTYRLTVTGSGGETDTDVVTIDVRPPVIFSGHDFDGIFADFVDIVPPGPFTSPGDAFGVLQRGVSSSIPFELVDDSLATFPGDQAGIVNDKKLDAWFGACDILNDDNPSGLGTATFNFTISGRSNIKVAIDMGAMGNFEATGGAGSVPDEYTWSASVDGGAAVTLFSIRTDEAIDNTYRLASGTTVTVVDPFKVNASTVLTNILRTFTANLGMTGSSLVLTLNASSNGVGGFAFDNILLYECEGGGDPCPCDGDVNNSGQVDIADLALLLSSFGSSAPNIPAPCADVNADGVVNLADLALLLSRFGANCP